MSLLTCCFSTCESCPGSTQGLEVFIWAPRMAETNGGGLHKTHSPHIPPTSIPRSAASTASAQTHMGTGDSHYHIPLPSPSLGEKKHHRQPPQPQVRQDAKSSDVQALPRPKTLLACRLKNNFYGTHKRRSKFQEVDGKVKVPPILEHPRGQQMINPTVQGTPVGCWGAVGGTGVGGTV